MPEFLGREGRGSRTGHGKRNMPRGILNRPSILKPLAFLLYETTVVDDKSRKLIEAASYVPPASESRAKNGEQESIWEKPGAVLVFPHVYSTEVLALANVVPGKAFPVHPWVAYSFFNIAGVRSLLKGIGALEVAREKDFKDRETDKTKISLASLVRKLFGWIGGNGIGRKNDSQDDESGSVDGWREHRSEKIEETRRRMIAYLYNNSLGILEEGRRIAVLPEGTRHREVGLYRAPDQLGDTKPGVFNVIAAYLAGMDEIPAGDVKSKRGNGKKREGSVGRDRNGGAGDGESSGDGGGTEGNGDQASDGDDEEVTRETYIHLFAMKPSPATRFPPSIFSSLLRLVSAIDRGAAEKIWRYTGVGTKEEVRYNLLKVVAAESGKGGGYRVKIYEPHVTEAGDGRGKQYVITKWSKVEEFDASDYFHISRKLLSYISTRMKEMYRALLQQVT